MVREEKRWWDLRCKCTVGCSWLVVHGVSLRALMLLLFTAQLCYTGGEFREISIDIISPLQGAIVDVTDPKGLPLHVKIYGLEMPQEGFAKIFLDGQLIADMEEAELYLVIHETKVLSRGAHKVTVQLMDNLDKPLGAEKYVSFTVVLGDEPVGRQAGSGQQLAGRGGDVASGNIREGKRRNDLSIDGDPCELDRLQTIASGPGLLSVSAGIASQFVITPRSASGLLIDPRRCPGALPLLVIIVPAPVEHQMVRSEDGLYTCRWTNEYASKEGIKIEIKVGLETHNSHHIRGSPFTAAAHPMYRVHAESALRPKAWEYGGRHLHTSRERHHHVPENALGAPLVRGGDAAGIASACNGPPRAGLTGRCAFVTMISTDDYLAGALTLLYSVRKTGSQLDFLAMITSDGLQPATIHSLSTAGMKVVTVRRMKKADIRDMSEERWNDNYTKLRLWQLAYERIIFLDSDMLVLQPLDHLFALSTTFAAVPDAFHPCYLNTGFMFIQPDNATFAALAALIDEVSSEESEQTLVNHYWLDRYYVLHYTYNFAKHNVMSPTRHDIYVDRYMDTVKVVHYLGVKPWLCSRDLDCMRHVHYYGGEKNYYLYDLWWSIFESMCDEGPVICASST